MSSGGRRRKVDQCERIRRTYCVLCATHGRKLCDRISNGKNPEMHDEIVSVLDQKVSGVPTYLAGASAHRNRTRPGQGSCYGRRSCPVPEADSAAAPRRQGMRAATGWGLWGAQGRPIRRAITQPPPKNCDVRAAQVNLSATKTSSFCWHWHHHGASTPVDLDSFVHPDSKSHIHLTSHLGPFIRHHGSPNSLNT